MARPSASTLELYGERQGSASDNPLRHIALENLAPQGFTNHSHSSVQDRFEGWWRSLVLQ